MRGAMAVAPRSRVLFGHHHSSSCFRSTSISISTVMPSSGSAITRRSLSNIGLQRRGVQLVGSDHYEENATKYWDNFYKRHHNKFFKDRHYLEKEWGRYFSAEKNQEPKVVLEVGCGAGNTIFPLIAAFPNIYVHACDFSPHAISLVKSHGDFREDQMNPFVCDVTSDDLCQKIVPSSVDIVTLIFMLSAVSPKKMSFLLKNIQRTLKPNGYVLVRDYATGDFAQEKLTCKNQMIGENFYVRGDGTCVFYFSEDFLSNLFKREGFNTEEINVYCKQITNRSQNIVMDRFGDFVVVISLGRRWIRAVFSELDCLSPLPTLIPESDDSLVTSFGLQKIL